MDQLRTCRRLCIESHKGQFRRGGDDYFKHPLRMSQLFEEEGLINEACVAALHDTFEDTMLTGVECLDAGVDKVIVDAVACLTRTAGEDYDDYINHIAKCSDLVLRVKIADILDNVSDSPTEKQMKKYRKALLTIMKGN